VPDLADDGPYACQPMSDIPADVHARIAELVQPTEGDVLRAKRVLLGRKAGEPPAPTSDLLHILVDEEGIPRAPNRDDRFDVPPGSDPRERIDPNDPLVLRERLRLATRVAIAELVAEGLLVEVDGPDNVYVSVALQLGNLSADARIAVPQPKLGAGYQLARRIRADVLPILDSDVFTADLATLGLDRRTLACLREALDAYRRGLYLSSANMLGAVSEGAWYAAGERLRGRVEELDRALDADDTAKVIRLTSEELAKGTRLRATAAELHSHAAYSRDLRNYGVHPRPGDDPAAQEHAFTEAGCALLLLETHRYLERLAAAVEQVTTL
jgi:hypothetical protein